MTSRDFCFWLQGFFELTAEKGLADTQCETIKRHLSLVFVHEIDPSMGGPAVQTALGMIHKPEPDHKIQANWPAPGIPVARC